MVVSGNDQEMIFHYINIKKSSRDEIMRVRISPTSYLRYIVNLMNLTYFKVFILNFEYFSL